MGFLWVSGVQIPAPPPYYFNNLALKSRGAGVVQTRLHHNLYINLHSLFRGVRPKVSPHTIPIQIPLPS